MSQELKKLFSRASESQIAPKVSCIEVDSAEFFENYAGVVEACGVPVMCLPVSRGVLIRFELFVTSGGSGDQNVAHLLVKSVDPETFDSQLKKASKNVDV